MAAMVKVGELGSFFSSLPQLNFFLKDLCCVIVSLVKACFGRIWLKLWEGFGWLEDLGRRG